MDKHLEDPLMPGRHRFPMVAGAMEQSDELPSAERPFVLRGACPRHVAVGVQRFLAEFGLTFGAFDFIVHAGTGEWYLLECNAAGQWGWLAEECDLPIAQAIAEELMAGMTR
jgi:hypothetical protein